MSDGAQGLLGLAFLDKAHDRIDHDDRCDHCPIDDVPEHERGQGRSSKEIDEAAIEVRQEAAHWAGPRGLGKAVGSPILKAALGFSATDPVDAALGAGQALIRGKCVPVSCFEIRL